MAKNQEGDLTMAGPMKPSDVGARKTESIPEPVFEVFNRLIAAAWDGHAATLKEADVARFVADAMNMPVSEVYARHLLDVEESYQAAGWNVEYDKPGYDETYAAAVFRFTLGKRG